MRSSIIAMEAVSILILLIVIYGCVFENAGKSRKAVSLAILASVGVAGTGFDMISFIVSGIPRYSTFMWVMNALALISAGWFGVWYVFYTLGYIRDKGIATRHYYRIGTGWGIFTTIFTTIGCCNGEILSIDEGAFITGRLYFVNLALLLVSGIFSIFLVIRYYKLIGFHDAIALLGYVLAPIVTTLLEYFVEGLAISFVGLSVSILILYIFIQSGEVKDFRLKEETARAMAKEKTDFLAKFSHEIRTPINAVIGLDELILREAKDENLMGYAKDIQSASNTLLTIINDILDSSRLESGRVELVEVNYDTVRLFNDIHNMLANRAKSKGLELILEFDEHLPAVLYGDEVKLKQVTTNVLTNAVKYTEKGSVSWRVSLEDTFERPAEELNTTATGIVPRKRVRLRFTVQDTGIGIRAEDMEKLFQPFERLDEHRNRSVEGTGLGMFITQSFLELMDSRLEVTSEYGKGSCFSFVIEQGVSSEQEIGNYEQAVKKYHGQKHEYQVSFTAPEAKVLIVDDTPLNVKLTQKLLAKTQVICDSAMSGATAIEMCCEKKYDLILMDQMMPGMDGPETLQKLRSTPEASMNLETPIIALTANVSDGARESLLEQGFTDYLTKPVDPVLLERMVCDHLPRELVNG